MPRERDGYPPGVPCWVDRAQPDPEAAVRFYGGLFGWEFEDRMPTDASGQYLVARLRGRAVAAVGSQPEGVPPAVMWNTYIWVASADDTAAQVKAAGGTALMDPFGCRATATSSAGRPRAAPTPGRRGGAARLRGRHRWVRRHPR
jgi:predicted enzyme related to lactoylglutathione lyase